MSNNESSTRPRKHIPTGKAMTAVLADLKAAGSSVDQREFRRIVAKHYSTDNSVREGVKVLKKRGLIELRVHLTPHGLKRLVEGPQKIHRKRLRE